MKSFFSGLQILILNAVGLQIRPNVRPISMKAVAVLALFLLMACHAVAKDVTPVTANPKHEFRGAWMHIIGQ